MIGIGVPFLWLAWVLVILGSIALGYGKKPESDPVIQRAVIVVAWLLAGLTVAGLLWLVVACAS